LVICPASLKYQWEDEIGKFTNYSVTVIDGDLGDRVKIYKENDSIFTVINYELVRQDMDLDRLRALDADVIILDEAHKIKNKDAITTKQIMQLDAKYKWLLTGTPMQNRPDELYSLFSFMNPEILGSWTSFRNRYIVMGTKFGRRGIILGYKNLNELRGRISLYILRRLVDEVAPELPSVLINNFTIPMTKEQAALHEDIRLVIRDIMEEMKSWDKDEPHPKEGQLLGMFTMLTEVSDSPQLLSMSTSRMASKFAIKSTKSPKLDELYELMQLKLEDNPDLKAVIFTQFERMQRLIVERLSKLGGCRVLNGKMKPYERQAAIDRFRFDKDVKFFVSTDAGNAGINLQIASVLVNYDLPWNPATLKQRIGRIRRIGSEFKTVNVVNLISQDSIDERILQVLYSKTELSDQIVEKTDQEKAIISSLTGNIIDKLTKQKRKRK